MALEFTVFISLSHNSMNPIKSMKFNKINKRQWMQQTSIKFNKHYWIQQIPKKSATFDEIMKIQWNLQHSESSRIFNDFKKNQWSQQISMKPVNLYETDNLQWNVPTSVKSTQLNETHKFNDLDNFNEINKLRCIVNNPWKCEIDVTWRVESIPRVVACGTTFCNPELRFT